MLRSLIHQALSYVISGEPINAVENCHVRGLSSIVLVDRASHRIRMFFAEKDHQMWTNMPIGHSHNEPMSLGFHGHRQSIELHHVFGQIRNLTAVPVHSILKDGEWVADGFYPCRIDSKLLGGDGKLKQMGPTPISLQIGMQGLRPGQPIVLAASRLHTVHVQRNTTAAWIVMEGTPSPDYDDTFYTNNPSFDLEEMYRPMAAVDVVQRLRTALRLCEQ